MQQEAADKLFGLQRHRLLPGIVAIILVAECDLALSDVQEPIIGNGHAVGITADVVQYLLGTGEAGRVITECPLSTSDGVKALDAAWLRPGRAQELHSTTCLVRAPEICVEVLSVSNTPAEIAEKIALYFEAGAQEVWTCDQDGTLELNFSTPPEVRQASEICPKFPSVIRFSDE